MTARSCDRIVLIGFMGAGKSTVGRGVAEGLGWRFIDLDEAVEAEAGCPVAEIFDRFGEAHFRRLEAETGDRVLREDRVVVATGGGWPVRPGSMEELGEGTLAVWLRVSLGEALRRAESDPQARPLLTGVRPVDEARDTVAKRFDERRVRYSLATSTVDTEGRTVEDVTAHVLRIVAAYESEKETE